MAESLLERPIEHDAALAEHQPAAAETLQEIVGRDASNRVPAEARKASRRSFAFS